MPISNSAQEIQEVFDYMDRHNDVGVTPDELYEAGLFGRKGDAASWLSRWKRKGFIVTKPDKNTDYETNKDRKRRLRYFTITDSSIRDWANLLNSSFRVTQQLRYEIEQSNKQGSR